MSKFYTRDSLIDAWQYHRGADVPVWVVKAWHDLGDGKLSSRRPGGLVAASPGDWIVRAVDGEQEFMSAVSHDVFVAEFMPAIEGRYLEDFARERVAQDREHGGPAHDDQHTPRDWIHFLSKQLDRALVAERVIQRMGADAEISGANDDYRRRLVKIGALALAALESFDRVAARAHVESPA